MQQVGAVPKAAEGKTAERRGGARMDPIWIAAITSSAETETGAVCLEIVRRGEGESGGYFGYLGFLIFTVTS